MMSAQTQAGISEAGGDGQKRFRLLRAVLPWVLIILIFEYIFIYQVSLTDVIEAVKSANLGIFIPVFVIFFSVSYMFGLLHNYLAFNWLAGRTGFKELFFARGASMLLAMVNPFAGAGGLGLWLSRKKQVPALEATGIILLVLFTDLVILFTAASAGALLIASDVGGSGDLISRQEEMSLLWFCLIFLAVLIFDIVVWVKKPKTRFLSFYFRGPLSVFERVRLKHFVILCSLCACYFCCQFFMHYFLLRTFGAEVKLIHIICFLPLVYLIVTIPITPLQLGTSQAAWIFFFSRFADEPTILAYSILISFASILTCSIIGSACMPWAYKDLVETRKKAGG